MYSTMDVSTRSPAWNGIEWNAAAHAVAALSTSAISPGCALSNEATLE